MVVPISNGNIPIANIARHGNSAGVRVLVVPVHLVAAMAVSISALLGTRLLLLLMNGSAHDGLSDGDALSGHAAHGRLALLVGHFTGGHGTTEGSLILLRHLLRKRRIASHLLLWRHLLLHRRLSVHSTAHRLARHGLATHDRHAVAHGRLLTARHSISTLRLHLRLHLHLARHDAVGLLLHGHAGCAHILLLLRHHHLLLLHHGLLSVHARLTVAHAGWAACGGATVRHNWLTALRRLLVHGRTLGSSSLDWLHI